MNKPSEPLPLLTKLPVVLVLLSPAIGASCFTNSSLGRAECVHIARYSGRQWSTCVTSLYLRQKSKGKHGCSGNAAHCLYQCMLEEDNSNFGEVKSLCRCSLNDKPETPKNPTTLPSWCFSPTGTECNWYTTCLSRRYVCGEEFDADILAFGEQFCKLYLNAYSKFTPVGELWINGVRKCLQVSLVPFLRPWQRRNSCENLTRDAMLRFTNCLVSPFPGTIPSICEVPLPDLWGVFWHLRQTLAATSRRGLKVILGLIENCSRFRETNLSIGKVRKFVLQLTKVNQICNSRYQKFGEDEHLAKLFSDKLAEEFVLERKGVSWFGYDLVNNTEQITYVGFYIADKLAYKLGQKSQPTEISSKFNNTVSQLVKTVRRNGLRFEMFPNKQQYCLTGIVVCRNFECSQNSRTVSSQSNTSSSSTVIPGHWFFAHCRTLVVALFALVYVEVFIMSPS